MKLNDGSKFRNSSFSGNSNRNPPKENVLVEVVQVHAVNKDKATKEQDTVEVKLLHDAFELPAGTIVKARIDHAHAVRYKNPDPKKTPMEMWDLAAGKKKGSGAKMGDKAVVLFEKAHKGADDVVVVQFLHVAEHVPNSPTECAIENVMTTVEEEKVGNDGKARQTRRIYLPLESEKVTTEDELRAAVIKKLEDDRPGNPFAVIRVMKNELIKDAEGNVVTEGYPYEAYATSVFRPWDRETEGLLSGEASFDRFLTDEKKTPDGGQVFARDEDGNTIKDAAGNPVPELRNARMISYLNAYFNPETEEDKQDVEKYTLEVIGGFSYTTGPLSLPSAKGRLSDHYQYLIDWENPDTAKTSADRETGVKFKMTGICASTILLGRVDNDGAPWYAQKTFTTKQGTGREIYTLKELKTPHTPVEIAESFKAQATRRSASLRAAFDNQDKSNNSAKSNKANDDMIEQDGEPDYTGGAMSVGR
jgi:hypothetical protein